MENNVNNSIIEQLNSEGIISFVPTGNSMWPTLKHKGQSVVVQKKQQRLSKFDVALYLDKSGALVLHRVLRVVDGGYVTRGDSQVKTESVPENNVIGVMLGFYQKNEYVDVNSEEYILKISKWLNNERKRVRKINRFYFTQKVKGKLKKLFGKKGNKNV